MGWAQPVGDAVARLGKLVLLVAVIPLALTLYHGLREVRTPTEDCGSWLLKSPPSYAVAYCDRFFDDRRPSVAGPFRWALVIAAVGGAMVVLSSDAVVGRLDPSAGRRCVACMKRIHRDATKCPFCQTDQHRT